MFFLRFVAALVVFSSFFVSSFAQAESMFSIWGGGNGLSDNLEFDHRHIDDPKTPHNYRWQEQDWSPEQWVEARGSAEALLHDFYRAGFITKQYDIDGVPALDVGQGWMDLSMQERVRVLRVVDYMYEITKNNPDGTILIYRDKMSGLLGVYTVSGLQLQ